MQGKHTTQPCAYAALTNGSTFTSLRMAAYTAMTGAPLSAAVASQTQEDATSCARA